ncbi:hypothetical protein ACJJTC_015786 [Scirpophaga incertulas]
MKACTDERRAGLTRTNLQFKEIATPPSQPSSRNITPRGSAESSRQPSRQPSSERPVDAPPTSQDASTPMMLKKVFYALKPMERSASLQNVATTSYATITGSPREQRDPRLRTRTQQKTPETPRGPFDKAHRSPVKTPEAPKPFCRPPKRQQDPEDVPSTAGRSIRQKIDDQNKVVNNITRGFNLSISDRSRLLRPIGGGALRAVRQKIQHWSFEPDTVRNFCSLGVPKLGRVIVSPKVRYWVVDRCPDQSPGKVSDVEHQQCNHTRGLQKDVPKKRKEQENR